ncbi:MAG: 2OG-Fe(II) oxygenase [Planctomycetaceae bacterium]|nr:2OG-Fe(II) oxygenase [Planctomycetaceae bacterium]
MSVLDLSKLRRTPLVKDPFEYCIVSDFIDAGALDRIERDFPQIEQGGSFPLTNLQYGRGFQELVDALLDSQTRSAFGEYFGIDLANRPPTLTVRGRARTKDGQIHIDSKTKLITVLIYFNRRWGNAGGCLRLLRSPDDIEDVIVEVPPESGTLLAFRCRENAWHGHKPFDGIRRSIQLNWVVDESAAKRSERRHGWSSLLKRLRIAG